MSPTRAAAVVAAAALGALLGCKLEPEIPELRHSLSAKVLSDPDLAEYAADKAAQDQLRGALEMLVGTPAHPALLLTEAMLDEEFDPNHGANELSDEAWESIVADNTRRFAAQLAALKEHRFDDVSLPREALDLRERWGAALAAREGLEGAALSEADAAIESEWTETLTNYYPSLRESAEMFRRQCMHCHGVEGGGDGTTSAFLKPRPRDFRAGIFKFTSVGDKARPTRSDLFRVLTEGIYTTAMPSFRRFSDAQLHGLIDYVRLLSVRGRVEMLATLDYDPDAGGIPLESILTAYDDEWEEWREAAEHVVVYEGEVPRPTPEMIEHGRKLFFDEATANCASCHGVDFRGNGPSAVERDPETGEMVPIDDDWGNPIEPRDLTLGWYRFGRRPVDIFRRLHAGINGTPMPSQITLTNAEGQRLLSDEDLWALVHFVRSLSTHEMSVAASTEEAGH